MVNERTFPGAARPAADPRDNPSISPNEVSEWLELFGPEPETKPARSRKPIPPPAAPVQKKPKKDEDDDLDEWFRLFGYKK